MPARVKYYDNDILGFADVICVSKDKGVFFVQLTTLSNMSARKKKIMGVLKGKPKLDCWIEIWGWNARKKEFKVVKM